MLPGPQGIHPFPPEVSLRVRQFARSHLKGKKGGAEGFFPPGVFWEGVALRGFDKLSLTHNF